MTFPDRRARVGVAAAVGLVSLATYLATAGNGPYWQDSGLFLSGLYVGGGLAPQGYPLYLMLARPFVALLTTGGAPFTWSVHAFSAVWGAGTAALATLSVLWLATPGYTWFGDAPTEAPPRLDRPTLALGALAGLAVGWSYSLWFQSVNAEVYALNACVAMAVLYLLVRLGAEGALGGTPSPLQRRLCLALVAVFGLGFANHPSIVALVPALVVWLWTQRALFGAPRFVAACFALFFACGFLPYLYLPAAAAADPRRMYGWVTTWQGFWQHVRGARWTGAGSSYGFSTDRLTAFPGQVWNEFFAVGLLAAAWGLRGWHRLGLGACGVATTWAVGTFALAFVYLQGTEYDFWWLPLWGLGQVTVGWGLIDAWRRLAPRLPAAAHWPAVGAAALAMLLPHLVVNAPLCNRRDYHVPEDFARNLFAVCDRGALLLAGSDQECSLTRCLAEVRGARPDLFVLQQPVMADVWYADWARARYPELKVPTPPPGQAWTNEEWAMQFAWVNRPRPTYTSKRLGALKLPAGAAWIPAGGLWKLDWNAGADPHIDPKHWAFVYRNPNPFDGPARRHHAVRLRGSPDLRQVERLRHVDEIRRFHAQAWLNRANWHLDHGEPAEAVTAFHETLALSRDRPNPQLWFEAGQAAFMGGRDDLARVWLGHVPDTAEAAPVRSLYLGQLAAMDGDAAAAAAHFDFVRTRAPGLWAANEAPLREKGWLPR